MLERIEHKMLCSEHSQIARTIIIDDKDTPPVNLPLISCIRTFIAKGWKVAHIRHGRNGNRVMMERITSIFIVFCLFLAFSSCSLVSSLDSALTKDSGYKSEKFQTIMQACDWVHQNIGYETDQVQYNRTDYWASPDETYKSRKGDCEDFCILLMAIIYNDFNVKAELIIINNETHAIVYLWPMSKYYDPVKGIYLDSVTVNDRISYDTAMLRATTTH